MNMIIERHNPNPKIVEVEDHFNLKFRCKVCGQRWQPSIATGGKLYRGSWQCPQGCKAEK